MENGSTPFHAELVLRALESILNSVWGQNNLAGLLAINPQVHDPATAAAIARKAVANAPRDGTIGNTLGEALHRAGVWKAAGETLEKSVELRNGGDSFDWFFLVMANWQLGE